MGHVQESYDRATQTWPSRKRKTRKRSTGWVGLTARRRQVATLVRRGLSNREIAEKLGLAEGTVKQHVHAIHEKLKIHFRTELVIALMKQVRVRGRRKRKAQAVP
jgi:DNA-binding NarL/FixJ family response regulator